jgi:hypothetical protein
VKKIPSPLSLAFAACFLVYALLFPCYRSTDREIFFKGTLATGVIDRAPAPLLAYSTGPSLGGLVNGVLLIPFYFLGGSRYLWLNLLGALFFSAACLSGRLSCAARPAFFRQRSFSC